VLCSLQHLVLLARVKQQLLRVTSIKGPAHVVSPGSSSLVRLRMWLQMALLVARHTWQVLSAAPSGHGCPLRGGVRVCGTADFLQ
jgi:hypothetical protein